MRKRILCLVMAAVLALGLLSGCSVPTASGDTLSVVTTIFPEYDWVMNVLGDRTDSVDVTMLLDSGVDLHSYQPTADDIIKISQCDLFIYVGGESDSWVDDALQEAVNENMIVLDLMDILGDSVKEEELVEGMEAEEEEEAEEGPEYDEHIWLSLQNAKVVVTAMEEALSQLDEENAEVYAANAAAYREKLTALDEEYEAAVQASSVKTLLFGDRFPFRYLTDDYGLTYYAAFVGCSAESEASFETVTFLAGKLDELGLSAVMTLEGTDHKLAETVISASAGQSAEILSLNSMQSTTSDDVKNGATYLSIMEKNLEVLKQALQ